MSIRQKTLNIVGITFLILLVVLTFTSHLVILGGFRDLEEEEVKEHIIRVQQEFSSTLERLNAIAGDWAPWDDTYRFIVEPSSDYIQSNLVESTFTTLDINFMIFLNSEKDVVYARNVKLSSGETAPFPNDLLQTIIFDKFLITHQSPKSSKTGVLMNASLPVYVASRPILTSDFSGPIRGSLILGRYIDAAEIERIAENTHVRITLLPAQEMLAAVEEAPEQIMIRRINSDTIIGYAPQDDIHGKPAFWLQIDMARQIANHGRTTLVYYILSLLATGLIFIILITRLLDTIVLTPLSELSDRVREIGEHGDASQKLPIIKQDELGNLARTINLMLGHLLETRINLEVANRVKSDFLSIISHELRTPLVPIISNTELLLWEAEENNTDGLQKECLQDILKYSQDLHHLINDILDLSSLETGEMELSPSPVNLRSLLENSLNIVRERAAKRNLSLSLSVQSLPETMNADERKLKQVLYSLLTNAIKFTPEGGTVLLSARFLKTDISQVEICVQDTGIGLDPTEIQRIFHPFQQLENPLTRTQGGAGLGLTLTKKIIELHGGTIQAESAGKGKGARFRVLLPIVTKK